MKAVCRFIFLLLSQFFGGSIFAARFSFAFSNFAHYYVVLLNAPLSDRDKKTCLQWETFPGKSWSIVTDTRRSRRPTGSRFQEANLLAWRELFANLYELKSRIGYGRNKSASSKFKGYLDLTYFRQTSREDFKNNDERKWVGKFWYLKYLSLGVHLHKTSRIFLATPTLDADIYTTSQTIRKSLTHSCWLMPWD